MVGFDGLVEIEFSLAPEMKKHFVQAPSEESYSINFVEVSLLASFSTVSAKTGHPGGHVPGLAKRVSLPDPEQVGTAFKSRALNINLLAGNIRSLLYFRRDVQMADIIVRL